MEKPVVKNASYILAHAPNTLLRNGATQRLERSKNPDSQFLDQLPNHLRSYQAAKRYPPYHVYIGGMPPEDLRSIEKPWYEHPISDASRQEKFGEIMPEAELFGLMKVVDAFNLVWLEKNFSKEVRNKLEQHPFLADLISLEDLNEGETLENIKEEVEKGEAPLYLDEDLVGCVRAATEDDENLSAHIMLDLLGNKATAVLALAHAFEKSEITPKSLDFIIECSEEAAGDVYNRGGGGIGKSIGEVLQCENATGIDLKAFCAAPAHAVVQAAALVKSGTYENVAVVAGGSVAKLGMNAKDHVKEGKPALEDVLGGVAIIVSANDGKNPVIRPIGKHKIGAGSSPKDTLNSLVVEPLKGNITSIEKYAPELQSPEIVGQNVPRNNYKQLGALAAMRGEIEKSELDDFVEKHGVIGFAPQQGHIPSGVPYIGHAREKILKGELRNAMIIGKGSLFLARLTKLFDGVSFLIEENTGKEERKTHLKAAKKQKVGITLPGSEHGRSEIIKGAELADDRHPEIDISLIGPKVDSSLEVIETKDEIQAAHEKMEQLLAIDKIDAAVTLHYSFPLGTATVGRVTTPNGEEILISTTTGTISPQRIKALTLNAIAGIATAKAIGIEDPEVGILNIEGARECEHILEELQENGFDINFAESIRPESGPIMRGNDVLNGTPDVLVCDSLTGNVLVKLLSSFTTSGKREIFGYGYGPGVGEKAEKPICILSRASGAPVIANTIKFAARTAKGDLMQIFQKNLKNARNAGMKSLIEETTAPEQPSKEKEEGKKKEVEKPPKKVVTEEIEGIDVMRIEESIRTLWDKGIYCESGMGCTGPVILVNEKDIEKARTILEENGFI